MDDPRLKHIKNKCYKPIIRIKQKLKINHNLKQNRLEKELTKIATISLRKKKIEEEAYPKTRRDYHI